MSVRPTTRFYVGLTAGVKDPVSGIAWTEISKARAMTLSRGAEHELSHVDPARATVLLENRDASLDPSNTASPHYPNLKPMNRLRITNTWDGVTYNRFTGYVTDYPPVWASFNSGLIQLEALDALGAVLSRIDLPDSPLALEIQTDIEANRGAGRKSVWLRLGDSQGSLVAADHSGHNLNGTYQGDPGLGLPGLVGGDPNTGMSPRGYGRASMPQNNLISGFPFTVECLIRMTPDRPRARMLFAGYDRPISTASQVVQVMVQSDQAPSDAGKIVATVANPYPTGSQSVSTITVDDGAVHHVVIKMPDANTLKIWIDGVDRTNQTNSSSFAYPTGLVTGYGVGNSPAINFGNYPLATLETDVIDEVVVYDGLALADGRIQAHANAVDGWAGDRTGDRLGNMLVAIGWPFTDTTIDPGISEVPPGFVAGSALAYAQLLERTEGGRLFVDGSGRIVFHDRHRRYKPPATTSSFAFGEGTGQIGYSAPLAYGQESADLRTRVTVTREGGTPQTVSDPTAQTTYLSRELALSGLQLTNDEEGKDRASFELDRSKAPTSRVTNLTVKPQEDPAVVWPLLLNATIETRCTVTGTPPGRAAFSQEVLIEKFDESATAKEWQMALRFSAAETRGFAIMGTSTMGSASARMGY